MENLALLLLYLPSNFLSAMLVLYRLIFILDMMETFCHGWKPGDTHEGNRSWIQKQDQERRSKPVGFPLPIEGWSTGSILEFGDKLRIFQDEDFFDQLPFWEQLENK